MLKILYRSGPLEITVEGGNSKELFKALAAAEEVFAADRQCGLCAGEDLRHRVRQTADYEFFELVCLSCSATLAYGQRKSDGQLFPRRKGEDGKPLEHAGWAKWNKEPPTRPRLKDSPVGERNAHGLDVTDADVGF